MALSRRRNVLLCASDCSGKSRNHVLQESLLITRTWPIAKTHVRVGRPFTHPCRGCVIQSPTVLKNEVPIHPLTFDYDAYEVCLRNVLGGRWSYDHNHTVIPMVRGRLHPVARNPLVGGKLFAYSLP